MRIAEDSTKKPDVAVVGAGPIGLAAARIAAESGARTLVVEKKSKPSPSCCTGLVSPQTLSTLEVSNQCVLQKIYAVCVQLPSGRQINLQSDDLKAVTIDRGVLERELLDKARSAGAIIQFNTEAVGASNGVLQVNADRISAQLHPEVIMGADGPRSRIASWFSIEQPAEFAIGAQVEVEGVSFSNHRVKVFFGSTIAPGFFGWSVPAQDGVLRIGLGVLPPHNPNGFLDRLLAKHYPTARIRSRATGYIPLARVANPTAPGLLLVGDAAGQLKPLSGGGLYTGGLCARLAGTAAARIAKHESGSEDRAVVRDDYQRQCLEAIGKEQAFGHSMRTHLSHLSDTDIEAMAEALDDPQLLQFLADEANIDCFHKLPDRLACEPRLWSTLLRMVPLLGSLTN